MASKFMVVGTGGREHAIAWRLGLEGHEVVVAPGSDGIGLDARCVAVSLEDHQGLVALARREAVDVVVVGPEQPLVDGLGDRLREAGVACFGPSTAAAELEGSKAAAKRFMARHGIPTARHETVASLDDALAAIRRFDIPPVVKADGLAAGKGVTVAGTFEEAERAVRACLSEGAFGSAGAKVVLEERLVGEEASVFALTDGTSARLFLPAQDHKRIGDGDTGPNTGGMGAYAPAPICSDAVLAQVRSQVIDPTLAGLREEGRPFVGVLFVGLMIDPSGRASVIEYNCRFGDPEVQPLLFGLDEPLGPHLLAAAHGGLESGTLRGHPAATVVLASAGYPASARKGDRIHGIELAERVAEAKVFHAGTRRGPNGEWETAGGRVLGVCARGSTLEASLDRAYDAVGRIQFAGMQWRRDIGARARP